MNCKEKTNQFKNYIRMIFFILISLFLRWPIWFLFLILKPFKLFDFLFLVYPGSDKDFDGYCPKWLAKSWLFSKKPTIGGIIIGKFKGLVLVIPNTAQEFFKKETSEKIIKRLKIIKFLTGAKSVAIAGQGPGIISKHIKLDESFMPGNKGTVFCVMETISEVMKIHNLEIGKFNIVLVGVGYVGSILLNTLKEEGHNIVGVDIKIRRHDIVLPKNSYQILNQADMIIVLTPRGSDFVPYLPYLKKGVIVIDDTHPMIIEKINDAIFYKVASGLPGTKIIPNLPGYQSHWIPGCTIEAMYSIDNSFNLIKNINQKYFNKRLKSMGFYAHIIKGAI